MTPIEQAICDIENSDESFIEIENKTGDFELQEITSLLNDRDYHAIIIDRAPVTNKETLMHAFYQNVRFPGYFGFNWDSLKDILADIDGVRSKGFIFAFSDLSQIDQADRQELIEVIEDANEIREQHDGLEKLRILTLKT